MAVVSWAAQHSTRISYNSRDAPGGESPARVCSDSRLEQLPGVTVSEDDTPSLVTPASDRAGTLACAGHSSALRSAAVSEAAICGSLALVNPNRSPCNRQKRKGCFRYYSSVAVAQPASMQPSTTCGRG